MDLKQVYPLYVHSEVLSPESYYRTDNANVLLKLLNWNGLFPVGLTDLFAIDYQDKLDIVWVFRRYSDSTRFVVQSPINDWCVSMVNMWPCAAWFEREIYEMFGAEIPENRDLRRLLTDYGFQGFPLLKSFPVTGFVVVRYSEIEKRITTKAAVFAQDFRVFDYQTPWHT